MKTYLDALQHVLDDGVDATDRTGVGTRSTFGYQMRFNLRDGFPAVTTKKLAWKAVVSELIWFLEGSTDERRLAEIHYGLPREQLVGKNTIWTANADAQGKALGYINTDTHKELGPVYGSRWRNWDGVDQIQQLINKIQTNPTDRRLIVSGWDVPKLDSMALPPCHCLTQFYVRDGKLSCQLYQRSVDAFLGLPFNIASYALLTHMIAQVTGLEVGEFIHTSGDLHIYSNHMEQVQLQLSREPLALPKLWINPNVTDINAFTMDSFMLLNYESHGTIKAAMAV